MPICGTRTTRDAAFRVFAPPLICSSTFHTDSRCSGLGMRGELQARLYEGDGWGARVGPSPGRCLHPGQTARAGWTQPALDAVQGPGSSKTLACPPSSSQPGHVLPIDFQGILRYLYCIYDRGVI
jgi:hypothetical protein